MKHIKSERLKKLETELNDLEQWLKLGLVPKKDVDKHKEEILVVRNKIRRKRETSISQRKWRRRRVYYS